MSDCDPIPPRSPIPVLGAGVIGLSCAVELLEAGQRVRVLARERTPNTTSDRAGALFSPFDVPDDRARIVRWTARALARFQALAADPPTGVEEVDVVEVRDDDAPPWWAPCGITFRAASAGERPPGAAHAIVARVPAIDMSLYLPWLERRVLELGGTIEHADVRSLAELARAHTIVVHCAGLDARELAADATVAPIRGQTLRIPRHAVPSAPPGRSWLDEATFAYIVPRRAAFVLGGTRAENDRDLAPRDGDRSSILERCTALLPALAGASLGDARDSVGLRPGRPTVRLEAERLGEATVVHCYGHGPHGVTLSWGCAADVAKLASHR